MNLVRRLFPFRTCTIDIEDGKRALARPCLLFHIKRCQGPCIEAVSKAEYGAQISQIELFLEGRQESVVQALTAEMRSASEKTDYERAATVRDKIRAIERTMESQKMAAFKRTELDMVGLARQDNQAAIQLFAIRNGTLIGRDVFLLDAVREAPDEEVLSSFLLAVLRARDLDPAAGARPVPSAGRRRPRGIPDRSAAVDRHASPFRSAARSGS